MMTDEELLFTTCDVARQKGVTPDAVRKAEREGRIEAAAVTASGVHLYTAENIKAYRTRRAARKRQAKG